MPAILSKEIKVTDDMLDYNGHVNNIVFVHWMQDVAIEHASRNGCTNEVYKEKNVSWVARSHHIDYLASAMPGDVVVAKTWIADARKVSCRRKYVFYRLLAHTQELKNDGTKDREILARAETEWVFVEHSTGRPRKIDRWIMEQFELMGEEPDGL